MSGLPLRLELDDHTLAVLAEQLEPYLAHRAPTDDPWLSIEEAAGRARCAKQRIYDLLSQGRLKGGRDGTRRLIRRSELDAYLESGQA